MWTRVRAGVAEELEPSIKVIVAPRRRRSATREAERRERYEGVRLRLRVDAPSMS